MCDLPTAQTAMTAHTARRIEHEHQAPSLEAGVAHDFKNLLFVITAHCQRLIQTLEPEDVRRRDAEAIAVAADRAVALTRQLLDRTAPGESARTVDLNALLGDLQGLLAGVVGERVQVRWSLSQDLWPLRANQTQLEQIIVNLAANARDAMPDGGDFLLATENRSTTDGSRHRDYVALTASDTGHGMSPDVQARMFDPYFTTKGADGNGVGLATVQAIVAASGGRIEVESAPGKGTAITILLPREANVVVMPPVPASVAQPRPRARASMRPRVLLVEDEPAVRDLLAHCLELEGYEPVVAETGRAALDVIDRPDADLDAVVTDLNLPDARGADIVTAVRAKVPGAGAVVISGASESALTEVRQTTPVLMKPFSLADFKRVMRAAVGERRAS